MGTGRERGGSALGACSVRWPLPPSQTRCPPPLTSMLSHDNNATGRRRLVLSISGLIFHIVRAPSRLVVAWRVAGDAQN
eukprot:1846835-Rhodomonas_salina.1